MKQEKYIVQYIINGKVKEQHGFFGLNKLDILFNSIAQANKRIKRLKQGGNYNIGQLIIKEQ